MFKILATSNAAKATFLTVIGLFLSGHPQIAHVAMIISKLSIARNAVVGFARLSGEAFATDNLMNCEAINLVVVVFWCHTCEAAW